MLNKELCKKCVSNTGILFTWNIYDEKHWEEDGIVCCPDDYIDKEEHVRKITGQPPANCPCLLEYALINQED